MFYVRRKRFSLPQRAASEGCSNGKEGGMGMGSRGSDIWNDSSDLGSVCLRYAWLVDKNQSALVSPFVPAPGRACPKSTRKRAEKREREREGASPPSHQWV